MYTKYLQSEATYLTRGARVVPVKSQNLTIEEMEGGLAKISVTESYSQSFLSIKEIAYYFNLPKGAVVAGLYFFHLHTNLLN